MNAGRVASPSRPASLFRTGKDWTMSKLRTEAQRENNAARARAWYWANRETVLQRLRERSPEERARANIRRSERYASDPEVRRQVKEQSARWRARPESKAAIAAAAQRYYSSERGRTLKRADRLMRYFSMTVDQYDTMYAAQGGLCAICKAPETKQHRGRGVVQSLSVDHDHRCCPERSRSCGKCVRGLLCDRCNLGRFPDDPSLLRAAADYFERYR
jgi:hypothetical protein